MSYGATVKKNGISNESATRGTRSEASLAGVNWQDFVRTILDKLNISKLSLSKKLSVSHPTVTRWLSGVSVPNKENQKDLLILCDEENITEEILAQAQGVRETELILSWKHSAQFAGFYCGVEQGFYKRLGLNVEIYEGGFSLRKSPISSVWERGRSG